MSDRPVVHVSPMGNLGNLMIQYMVARAIADFSGPARLSAIGLPLFGLEHAPIEGNFPATEVVTTHRVAVDRLAHALAAGRLQRVDIRTYGQRVENFLPAQAYRPVFSISGLEAQATQTGPDEVLCNIRQGDILDAHHPDYVLIPIDFYAMIVAESGLRPVFMGQLDESAYLLALRARFPDARFIPSAGPAADFERIRRSRFVIPAISTFSWLAAWLSDAERIFMPVLGLFNPLQNRGVNLLPIWDARFRFYVFPVHYAAPVAGFEQAHASIRGLWRQLPPEQLGELLHRLPPPRQKPTYLAAFDDNFYRQTHRDVAQAILEGHLPNARHHYETCGFAEGRAGFHLDRAWYCKEYPIAAVEIGQGEYWDPEHHWLETGRERNYRRTPECKRNQPC